MTAVRKVGKDSADAGSRAVSRAGNPCRKRAWLRAGTAVMVLFLAGLGYQIASSPPAYAEGAAVVFSLPRSQTSPNAYLMFAPSLIASSEAMTQILLSPQAQQQIREAGGTANVSLALVNLYDQEYPNYGVPLAHLTVSSESAESVRPTFAIAVRLLYHLLAVWQTKMDVKPHNRISAQIVGDTGLTVQVGSRKRVIAGLAVLTLVAYSACCGWLDRMGASKRPAWRGGGLRRPLRVASSRVSAVRIR